MKGRTTIIPVSLTELDRLQLYTRQYQCVGNFWADATHTSFENVLYAKAEEDRRSFLKKIRKAQILINHFFVGREREILMVLMNSVSPAAEVANLTGLCLEDAYRRISYLRRVMAEIYTYFDKRTYKRAEEHLKKDLKPRYFKIFSVYIRTRDYVLTAKLLGFNNAQVVKRIVPRIDKYLHDKSYKYRSIKDLFITWRRVRQIRKAYYGYHKSHILKGDLDKE